MVLQQPARTRAPANFAGRVGAFLAELSFQLFGYASYLIPAVLVVIGWHYFWCRDVGRRRHEGDRRGRCCSAASARSQPGVRHARGRRQAVPRRRLRRRAGSPAFIAEYLNRTGSVIVILTLIFLAIIMSTQFSLRPRLRRRSRHSAGGGVRARSARSATGARSAAARSSGARSSRSTRRRPA